MSDSLKNAVQNPSRARLVSRLDDQANDRFGVRSAHVQPGVFKDYLHAVTQIHPTAGIFVADRLQNFADLVRRAFQLLFDHLVSRQVSEKLGHGSPGLGQQMQDQSHSDQTVAAEIYAGVDNAAIALAADHRAHLPHHLGDVGLADLRPVERAMEHPRHVVHRRSGRKIGHDRARRLTQNVAGSERERVILAYRFAGFIDDGQPVGVHVLREADVGAAFFYQPAETGDVLRRRFGAARKRAVRRGVDRYDFGAQRLDQLRGDDRTRAVARIERDSKFARGLRQRADRTDDRVYVSVERDRQRFDAAHLGAGDFVVIALVIDVEQLARLPRAQKQPFGVDELQRVPFRRIMAGGDGYAALSVALLDHQLHGRYGTYIEVDHTAAARKQSSDHRLANHLARCARVAPDDDRA